MRPQQNRRIRGRSGNNGNNRRGPNPLTRNYESNGPDVRIRGNAQHIAEKYATLARDVMAAGDRVMAENYFQHAEHYMRIILSAQPQIVQPLRDDGLYEEGGAANVVELGLVDTVEPEDALLQLVVDRGTEEKEKGEDAGLSEKISVVSQEVKPKIEHARRMPRRRLPQKIIAEGESNVDLPARQARDADKVDAVGDKLHLFPVTEERDAKDAKPTVKDEEGKEKPRRRRRTVKNVADEAPVDQA